MLARPFYEKFVAMIELPWVGIVVYFRPENKDAFGFEEGSNNNIRILRRRVFGLRDEESLPFKILTCMLPTI